MPSASEMCLVTLATLSPFAVLAVITNGLAFGLFFWRKKLRRPSNILLLSLAGSDLLNGALNCPLVIAYFCQRLPGHVVPFLAPAHNFVAASCALHILAITAERFMAVTRPLRHHSVTKKTIGIVAIGIWLLSAFISFISLSWQPVYGSQGSPPVPEIVLTYAVFCLVVVFVVPCACMMYGYSVMFRIINSKQAGLKQLSGAHSRVHRKVKNDRKCLVVFACMAGVFVVCWLPFYLLMLIVEVRPLKMPPEEVFQFFTFMRYLSSIINPLLYTFFKKDFWKAFKQLLRRKRVNSRVSSSGTSKRNTSAFTLPRKAAHIQPLEEGSMPSLRSVLSTSDIGVQFVSSVWMHLRPAAKTQEQRLTFKQIRISAKSGLRTAGSEGKHVSTSHQGVYFPCVLQSIYAL